MNQAASTYGRNTEAVMTTVTEAGVGVWRQVRHLSNPAKSPYHVLGWFVSPIRIATLKKLLISVT